MIFSVFISIICAITSISDIWYSILIFRSWSLSLFEPFKQQTTDMNPGQAHCLDWRAQTLDSLLEIAERRRFEFRNSSELQNPNLKFLLYCKPKAQQGKQRSVGAREGFPYDLVKLLVLANGNRYEVDSNTYFRSGKALHSLKALPCPKSDPFWHSLSVVCALPPLNSIKI